MSASHQALAIEDRRDRGAGLLATLGTFTQYVGRFLYPTLEDQAQKVEAELGRLVWGMSGPLLTVEQPEWEANYRRLSTPDVFEALTRLLESQAGRTLMRKYAADKLAKLRPAPDAFAEGLRRELSWRTDHVFGQVDRVSKVGGFRVPDHHARQTALARFLVPMVAVATASQSAHPYPKVNVQRAHDVAADALWNVGRLFRVPEDRLRLESDARAGAQFLDLGYQSSVALREQRAREDSRESAALFWAD